MSSKKKQPTDRPKGRPPKGAPPALPAEEVDRLLVFGEVVTCDDGESRTVVYPSYRDLAERYRVSTTLIAKYSKDHNCLRRREQAKARVQAQADQKLVELRATAVALSKDDELRIIDGFLSGFEKALSEGRVRFDNPSDFNTMVRLKEFVMGGADSRQEIHASLSLEDIQARHQRMLRVAHTSGVVRGELADRGEVIDVAPEQPPTAPSAGAAEDLDVHLGGPSASSVAPGEGPDAGPAVGSGPAHDAPGSMRGALEDDATSRGEEPANAHDDEAFGGRVASDEAAARVLPGSDDAHVSEQVPHVSGAEPTEMNGAAGVHFSSAPGEPGEDAHAQADDEGGADGRFH